LTKAANANGLQLHANPCDDRWRSHNFRDRLLAFWSGLPVDSLDSSEMVGCSRLPRRQHDWYRRKPETTSDCEESFVAVGRVGGFDPEPTSNALQCGRRNRMKPPFSGLQQRALAIQQGT
jgi:hypothetical protein